MTKTTMHKHHQQEIKQKQNKNKKPDTFKKQNKKQTKKPAQ